MSHLTFELWLTPAFKRKLLLDIFAFLMFIGGPWESLLILLQRQMDWLLQQRGPWSSYLYGRGDVSGRENRPSRSRFLLSALMFTSGHPIGTRNCKKKQSRNMTETRHIAEVGSHQKLDTVFMKQSWWTDRFSYFWKDIHASTGSREVGRGLKYSEQVFLFIP